MVCLRFEPRAAGVEGWKALIKPLSYGTPPPFSVLKQVVIGRTIAQENVLIHKLLS